MADFCTAAYTPTLTFNALPSDMGALMISYGNAFH
ncbi:hypothetical protein CHELA1G11_60038 [Hyphomicrobiales bacterium]|nr:hypothetical protein CHELA41_10044 [Hyphomicrobiales bacterium]CAH1657233.1 hypothetical protein CHELA17_30033 [Chelatococcus asaccharovorans]CAH1660928.1 hypothetical protein CHELA20_20007 [Hyphomicrobiales bacterium]CAH1693377.1 hypothetical protein BOSEA31B_30037 [Hyphomicrobiales bacterium]CAH1695086.1 hypothetical protein CHELA40_60007 [Chelatococcus asaccharovorans]